MWNLALTLMEEYGLRVFENRVLWRVDGPNGEEGTEGWRTLHNEELIICTFHQIIIIINHFCRILTMVC
jgi:hypothetical protein